MKVCKARNGEQEGSLNRAKAYTRAVRRTINRAFKFARKYTVSLILMHTPTLEISSAEKGVHHIQENMVVINE